MQYLSWSCPLRALFPSLGGGGGGGGSGSGSGSGSDESGHSRFWHWLLRRCPDDHGNGMTVGVVHGKTWVSGDRSIFRSWHEHTLKHYVRSALRTAPVRQQGEQLVRSRRLQKKQYVTSKYPATRWSELRREWAWIDVHNRKLPHMRRLCQTTISASLGMLRPVGLNKYKRFEVRSTIPLNNKPGSISAAQFGVWFNDNSSRSKASPSSIARPTPPSSQAQKSIASREGASRKAHILLLHDRMPSKRWLLGSVKEACRKTVYIFPDHTANLGILGSGFLTTTTFTDKPNPRPIRTGQYLSTCSSQSGVDYATSSGEKPLSLFRHAAREGQRSAPLNNMSLGPQAAKPL